MKILRNGSEACVKLLVSLRLTFGLIHESRTLLAAIAGDTDKHKLKWKQVTFGIISWELNFSSLFDGEF